MNLLDDPPTLAEVIADEHAEPLPRCGAGDCFHARNDMICPADPWAEQPLGPPLLQCRPELEDLAAIGPVLSVAARWSA